MHGGKRRQQQQRRSSRKQAADEAADAKAKRQHDDRHQLGIVIEAAHQRWLPAELKDEGRDA